MLRGSLLPRAQGRRVDPQLRPSESGIAAPIHRSAWNHFSEVGRISIPPVNRYADFGTSGGAVKLVMEADFGAVLQDRIKIQTLIARLGLLLPKMVSKLRLIATMNVCLLPDCRVQGGYNAECGQHSYL